MSRSPLWVQSDNTDNPWRRLPWTVSATLLIWALFLWNFGHFIGNPGRPAMESPSVDAEMIELPALDHSSKAPSKESVRPRLKIYTTGRTGVPFVQQEKQRGAGDQLAVNSHATSVSAPYQTVSTQDAAHNGQVATSAGISTSKGSQTALRDGHSWTGTNMGANMGARAIVRPMPQIPDDLREAAFNSEALVSFHIAVDGSVKVELTKPTPDPRLNRILLASLKNWRFAPAIRAGQSVESTEEIVIRIEVK